MAEYRKQIAYLDYLEDGVKIKNAGFVRIEEQNGHNRMEVKVKNLPGKDCGEFRLQEEHDINSNEKFQSHHDGTVKRANQ